MYILWICVLFYSNYTLEHKNIIFMLNTKKKSWRSFKTFPIAKHSCIMAIKTFLILVFSNKKKRFIIYMLYIIKIK